MIARIRHAGRDHRVSLVPISTGWAWGIGNQSGVEPTEELALAAARDAVQCLENAEDGETLEKAS